MSNSLDKTQIEELTKKYKNEVCEINKKLKKLSNVPNVLTYVFAGITCAITIGTSLLALLTNAGPALLAVWLCAGGSSCLSMFAFERKSRNIDETRAILEHNRNMIWYEYLDNFENITEALNALLGPEKIGDRRLTHIVDDGTQKQEKKSKKQQVKEENNDLTL